MTEAREPSGEDDEKKLILDARYKKSQRVVHKLLIPVFKTVSDYGASRLTRITGRKIFPPFSDKTNT